jgi:hypothetical protein
MSRLKIEYLASRPVGVQLNLVRPGEIFKIPEGNCVYMKLYGQGLNNSSRLVSLSSGSYCEWEGERLVVPLEGQLSVKQERA